MAFVLLQEVQNHLKDSVEGALLLQHPFEVFFWKWAGENVIQNVSVFLNLDLTMASAESSVQLDGYILILTKPLFYILFRIVVDIPLLLRGGEVVMTANGNVLSKRLKYVQIFNVVHAWVLWTVWF